MLLVFASISSVLLISLLTTLGVTVYMMYLHCVAVAVFLLNKIYMSNPTVALLFGGCGVLFVSQRPGSSRYN